MVTHLEAGDDDKGVIGNGGAGAPPGIHTGKENTTTKRRRELNDSIMEPRYISMQQANAPHRPHLACQLAGSMSRLDGVRLRSITAELGRELGRLGSRGGLGPIIRADNDDGALNIVSQEGKEKKQGEEITNRYDFLLTKWAPSSLFFITL